MSTPLTPDRLSKLRDLMREWSIYSDPRGLASAWTEQLLDAYDVLLAQVEELEIRNKQLATPPEPIPQEVMARVEAILGYDQLKVERDTALTRVRELENELKRNWNFSSVVHDDALSTLRKHYEARLDASDASNPLYNSLSDALVDLEQLQLQRDSARAQIKELEDNACNCANLVTQLLGAGKVIESMCSVHGYDIVNNVANLQKENDALFDIADERRHRAKTAERERDQANQKIIELEKKCTKYET